MYYKVCESCGAHLDRGERCDCGADSRREQEKRQKEPHINRSGADPPKEGNPQREK